MNEMKTGNERKTETRDAFTFHQAFVTFPVNLCEVVIVARVLRSTRINCVVGHVIGRLPAGREGMCRWEKGVAEPSFASITPYEIMMLPLTTLLRQVGYCFISRCGMTRAHG